MEIQRGKQWRGVRPSRGPYCLAVSLAASCQLIGAAQTASSIRVDFCAACQEGV